MSREAILYQRLENQRVRCTACARYCNIPEGEPGFCGVRRNLAGKLYLLVYGRIVAANVDPIEKKPLTHYMPGSKTFSIGTNGCTWACQYCFTPDTAVFTDRGVKTLQEMYQEGTDEIWHGLSSERNIINTNALTHRGRLRKVRKIFRHFYHGEILTISPWYLPSLRCTPDHRILVTSDPSEPLTKMPARFVTKKNFVVVPKIPPRNSATTIDLKSFLENLVLPKHKVPMSNHRLLVTQAVVDDVLRLTRTGLSSREVGKALCLSPSTVRRVRAHPLPAVARSLVEWRECRVVASQSRVRYDNGRNPVLRYLKLDERFARLLGYYCAEGSVSKNGKRPNTFTTGFTFGSNEIANISKVSHLVENIFGLTCSISPQGSTTHVLISNSILGRLFAEMCGADCYSKKVPDEILAGAKLSTIKSFLAGYLAGDGYLTPANRMKNKTYLGSSSVSRMLSMGVSLLFVKLGAIPRFYTSENEPTTVIEGRKVNRHNDYLVKVLKKCTPLAGAALRSKDARMKAIECKDHYLVPVRRIATEEYSGFVYNMEVEDDHTYVANLVAVCNCQNHDMSQRKIVEGTHTSPEEVVCLTDRHGCQSIAYTYNEPTVFIEYARDTGILAREKGLRNIFVSNGYATPDSVKLMTSFLDAITVDFKGNGETGFLRRNVGIPNAEPIYQTLLDLKNNSNIHFEITDLIVPTIGDDLEEARKLSRWIHDNLGPDTPTHFIRFYPSFKLNYLKPTPVETLERHHEVAKAEGLRYVYIGNVPGHPLENTYCAGCASLVVRRFGFDITEWKLDAKNNCPKCGEHVPIVGSPPPG